MEQKHTPQILKLAEKRTVSARTNSEFLNEVVGTKYIQWYRSVYKISPNIIIWMIRINGKEHDGWINTWIDDDTILEEYMGNEKTKILRLRKNTALLQK